MLVYAIYTSMYSFISGYQMKSKGIKNNLWIFAEFIPLYKGLIGPRISAHVQKKKFDFNHVFHVINIIELEGTPEPM